jgi:ATP/maltotriose-dependent transcriptional regulator MalT
MEQALVHARNTGDVRQLYWIYFVLCVDLNLGPTPAMDAIRRCEQLLAEEGAHRGVAGACFHALAHLRAMTGEIEEAWNLATKFRDILWADGAIGDYLFFAEVPFNIKMLAGEPEEAVAILSEANERIEQLGGEPDLMLMAMLSQALYVTGRREEAQLNAEQALACTMPMSQRLAQSVLAMVMATEGELVEAERLAREAVAFFEGSDLLLDHAMCVMNLAEVLRLAGRPEDAASTADEAIGLYDRKGDIMSAGNARRFKRQLTAPA